MKAFIRRMAMPITTLGIGSRLCIWFSGCERRCYNCISQDLKIRRKADEIELESVISIMKRGVSEGKITGVTLSGGEPFLQSEAVFSITQFARSLQLDTLVYTGFTLSELKALDLSSRLECIDVLVTGEYADSFNNRKERLARLRGSCNQAVIFNNKELVRPYLDYCAEQRQVTIIDKNVIGIP